MLDYTMHDSQLSMANNLNNINEYPTGMGKSVVLCYALLAEMYHLYTSEEKQFLYIGYNRGTCDQVMDLLKPRIKADGMYFWSTHDCMQLQNGCTITFMTHFGTNHRLPNPMHKRVFFDFDVDTLPGIRRNAAIGFAISSLSNEIPLPYGLVGVTEHQINKYFT